jgi:hypothetical protein
VWISCCFLQLQCANEAGQRWRGLAALHAAGIAAYADGTVLAKLASYLDTPCWLYRPMLLLLWLWLPLPRCVRLCGEGAAA